jgi:predicted dehydrogenase
MLKWGILGRTFIADVMAQAIRNSPHSQLQAVAGQDLEKASAFQAKHAIPTVHAEMANTFCVKNRCP